VARHGAIATLRVTPSTHKCDFENRCI